jgi:hypothetical protein
MKMTTRRMSPERAAARVIAVVIVLRGCTPSSRLSNNWSAPAKPENRIAFVRLPRYGQDLMRLATVSSKPISTVFAARIDPR